MKSNYALAIQGSPRKDGITSVMLEKAIAEAKKNGYTVEKIDLYEQDIHYCKGCRSCLNTGMRPLGKVVCAGTGVMVHHLT